MSDWKPDLYLTFEKERTQPSIDLVMKIENEKPKRIIDIGCGPGNSTYVLKNKWPNAEIIGLDNSEAMIKQASNKYKDIQWVCEDALSDISKFGTFDIVFSNAVIQWIPNQHLLLSKLYQVVRKGGVLAVQVPCTKDMPIHTELMKLIEAPKWKKHFSSLASSYSIHTADFYYNSLCNLTHYIDLWETNYYHIMLDHKSIIKWYSGTGLRPYLDCFTNENKKKEFLDEYEDKLKKAYVLQKDKKVLFPFKRIFFVAKKI